jgi:membrane fusion protein, multidrug efflux system
MSNFSPAAGSMGGRNEFRETEAVTQQRGDGPASVRVPVMSGRKGWERLRRPLMLVLPIAVAALGAAMYLAEEPYVSTDNAFVRAAKVTVNARVAGQAVEIAVRDNERVRQGQVLFRIDPEP